MSYLQGCWANPDGANPDDRGNPDDFLGKSLKLFLTLFFFFVFISRPPKSSSANVISIREDVEPLLDLLQENNLEFRMKKKTVLGTIRVIRTAF